MQTKMYMILFKTHVHNPKNLLSERNGTKRSDTIETKAKNKDKMPNNFNLTTKTTPFDIVKIYIISSLR